MNQDKDILMFCKSEESNFVMGKEWEGIVYCEENCDSKCCVYNKVIE